MALLGRPTLGRPTGLIIGPMWAMTIYDIINWTNCPEVVNEPFYGPIILAQGNLHIGERSYCESLVIIGPLTFLIL